MDKQDIVELMNKGKYILSLCVNMETGNNFAPIEHHLPLIDSSKSEQDVNNWNLSESVKRTVIAYQKELVSYADIVTTAYRIQCSDMIEILPLWLVFPTYTATTIGWRMGIGEQYEVVYIEMLRRMSNQELEIYKSRYPAPEYMRLRSRYYDN